MENTKDPLLPYKTKRDFTITPEPAVSPESHEETNAKNPVLSFVVQKHDARSLHYDFRLELDGVLKSWAVPKGPSLDPKQKRLAVNVEDHPLEYAQFEGEIPPDQYGAGTVSIWDHGTWEPTGDPHQGLEKGDLKFTLHGEKLKGIWVLIHIHNKAGKKENTWLLVKERDSFARSQSEINSGDPPIPEGALKGFVPSVLSPQMATLVNKIPSGDEWTYEIKLDGYRMMARIFDDGITIFTRNGIDWTLKLKSIADSLKELKIAPGWVDGEIVYPGKAGLPDFGALQQAFDSKSENGIIYYLFDMPFYNGYDLRNIGLSERRSLLKNVLSQKESASARIRFSENFDAGGGDILDSACRLGLEGIMGKRKDSHYMSGRSQSWVKIKCSQRQEFVLVGFTENKSSGRDISALLLGVYDEAGHLRYAGRVGTGFNYENAKDLKDKLSQILTEKTPLYEKPKDASGIWVKPELVAEISFAEWTKEGRVRQAVFHGLRSDKIAYTVIREKMRDVPNETSDESISEVNPEIKTNRKGLVIDPVKPLSKGNPSRKISNPERVVDPSSGTRKIDIIEYYQLAADRILPHLENRPVAFLRAPSGIGGTLFFQKHAQTLRIPELKELAKELDPEHQQLMNIGSLTALIGAAQMNVIEFHTWNFTTKDPQKPDRMVFDLDPGEGLDWKKMIEAAKLTKTLLDKLGLKSFLKTSGGKGLHIVVPLMPHDDWDTVKNFSKAVSSHMAKVIPEMFSDISGDKNRVGKIFIDYIRNNFGSTTVSAYSVRARPGMGVSIPCAWEKIAELTGGAHWSVSNVHEYLESGENPWEDYFKTSQTISEEAKEILQS
ncbi:MAG: DNA ligase D [Saccharofermentanales bacterium]